MLPEVGTSREVRNLLTKGPSRPLVHVVQAVRGRRSGLRSGSEDGTSVLSSLGGCNLLGCFSWWFPEWDQLALDLIGGYLPRLLAWSPCSGGLLGRLYHRGRLGAGFGGISPQLWACSQFREAPLTSWRTTLRTNARPPIAAILPILRAPRQGWQHDWLAVAWVGSFGPPRKQPVAFGPWLS